MKGISNSGASALIQPAQQVMAVVLDYYKVPFAPEFVKMVDRLATTPPNLVRVLDFFSLLGDKRLAVAVSALKLVVAPSTIKEVFQTLDKIWLESDEQGRVPDYLYQMLDDVARRGMEALAPLLAILNLPMPDMELIAQHPWRVCNWLSALDQRLSAIGASWEKGDIAEALLRVTQYTGGISWGATPSEQQAVYELFRTLVRRYVWQ